MLSQPLLQCYPGLLWVNNSLVVCPFEAAQDRIATKVYIAAKGCEVTT
jgi:hypothetical protein